MSLNVHFKMMSWLDFDEIVIVYGSFIFTRCYTPRASEVQQVWSKEFQRVKTLLWHWWPMVPPCLDIILTFMTSGTTGFRRQYFGSRQANTSPLHMKCSL